MKEETLNNRKINDILDGGVRIAQIVREFNHDGTISSVRVQDDLAGEAVTERYQRGKIVEIIKYHTEENKYISEYFNAKGKLIKIQEDSVGEDFSKTTTRNPEGDVTEQVIHHHNDKKVTIRPKRKGLGKLLDSFKGQKETVSFEYEGSGRGTVVDKLADIDSKKEMDRQNKKRALVAEYRHQKVDRGGCGNIELYHKAPNPKVQKALEKYLEKKSR